MSNIKIQCISIINYKNNPLYIKNFSTTHPDLKYHYIAHTSCDVIEERISAGSEATDTYLGLLYAMEDLAVHLSDPNNNGKLNQDEFAVAMHLIYRKLNGYEIPTTLTAELIPPSTRDLTESVDMLKNYLASDIHNQQLGTGGGSNNYYLKSRSFTNLPVTSHNDATNYKHKDDDIGYVSSSRYKIPSTSLSSRECKKLMLEYLKCLKQNNGNNGNCRHLSKSYLKCRME
ncbi:2031_t:CDS:2, partial [Entrophospora sp. SA101]